MDEKYCMPKPTSHSELSGLGAQPIAPLPRASATIGKPWTLRALLWLSLALNAKANMEISLRPTMCMTKEPIELIIEEGLHPHPGPGRRIFQKTQPAKAAEKEDLGQASCQTKIGVDATFLDSIISNSEALSEPALSSTCYGQEREGAGV